MAIDPATVVSIGSAIAGLFGGNNRNKLNERMYAEQQRLAQGQTGQADQINNFVQQLMSMQMGTNDGRGGSSRYNPITGQWETTLGSTEQALQGANDQEALARDTIDQFIRRQGMVDAERLRGRAGVEADTEMDAIGAMRRGVNQLDPNMVANMIATDRQGAVNAGYDEVQRGLNTVGLRTGNDGSAVAQALARNRAADIARTRGSPMLEAIGFTDGINQQRMDSAVGRYGGFAGMGGNFINNQFGMTDRFGTAQDRTAQQQGLDLQRRQLGIAGAGAGAQILNNAAAGLRGGDAARKEGSNPNLVGGLLGSVADLIRK